MKLSEIRPCDNCKQKIAPIFYVVRISQALFTRETNQVLGLVQILGGSLELAEVMSPEPDVVKVFADENKALGTELFLCQNCVLSCDLNLAALIEQRNAG